LAGLRLSPWHGLFLCTTVLGVNVDIVLEVGIDGVLEVLNGGTVRKRDNVSIVNEDVETIGLTERVELVLEVLTVLDISLKAEDSPLLEVDWLADDLAEDIGVIEGLVGRSRGVARG
jgi:hypothetical protein